MIKQLLYFFITFIVSINLFSQKKVNIKGKSNLKAVIIVGHVEGQTQSAINEMEKINLFLKKQGVTTFTFYDKKADWNFIKKVANGAHFFIYNGHGSPGGSLNIESGGKTNDLLKLTLAKNAVVCFQSVCYGAGSSAGDDAPISSQEALRRINWYAEPFFKIGAGCYYANNYNNGVLSYLKNLFSGSDFTSLQNLHTYDTIAQYTNIATYKFGLTTSNFTGTSTRTSYINGVKKVEQVPCFKTYEIAWISNPAFSLKSIGQ